MEAKKLHNKTLLITGGTGSFGSGFARFLLENFKLKKLIILSRDEFKQFHMEKEFAPYKEQMRFFLGDVRDIDRLRMAFHDVDIVIHAAALKQVPALEYNPIEAIQTNILGSKNVITAAIEAGVSKVLLISTDKAAEPINLYGATKMCAEKLFVASNVYSRGKTDFSVVRYGNVIGSRGSVVETLLKTPDGPAHLTHEEMTRFWLTLDSSFQLVLFALEHMVGGELFVPKVPSMKLIDLFKAVVPDKKVSVIGVRPGEKIHEVLVTEEEAMRAYDFGDYFVVLPHISGHISHARYDFYKERGKALRPRFKFTSDTNKKWLTVNSLRKMLAVK